MTNVQTKEEQIAEYLLDNKDELRQIVSELNSWNGCLEHLDVHENDEYFFETFFSSNPMEAVRAAHYGSYSYTDAYVRFNGYGNLESLDDYQLEQEMAESVNEIVDLLIENESHIDIPDEIDEILNYEDYEEEEEEEEEDEE